MAHEEKHTCQVKDCGSAFWWSVSSFYSHFKLKHDNLSLQDYEKQYMGDYKESNLNTTKLANPNQTQDRYSECLFSCNICKPGKIFHSNRQAEYHMKSVHKTNLKDYKNTYGSSLVYKINPTCHLCAG